MATMRYAFDELHLERLDGSMIEYNQVSIQFYCEKLGWKKEGVRRNYYFRRGRYWDQVVVGITKADYINLLEKNKYWNE
jgi:RimJ/RimL family protein N-acetyltransferase